MNIYDLNFRKSPWRGILSEVAKDMGVTQGAVTTGLGRRDGKYVKAVKTKVEAVIQDADGTIDLSGLGSKIPGIQQNAGEMKEAV